MSDKNFMRHAIKEAEKAKYPYGAVLVRDNRIIARSGTTATLNDPTAHTETTVIRQACKALKTCELQDRTLYATREPCPMCFTAAWWAKPKRIAYGISLEESSKHMFPELKAPSEYLNSEGGDRIEIVGGILREEIVKLVSK